MRFAGISCSKPPDATSSTGRAIRSISGFSEVDVRMPETPRMPFIASHSIARWMNPLEHVLGVLRPGGPVGDDGPQALVACRGLDQHLRAE